MLGLTAHQVERFVINYLAQQKVWELYEHNVEKIPYGELHQYSVETKDSIADLIHSYPPKLSTDKITRDDAKKAIKYLESRRLDKYIGSLEGWMGTNTGGFIKLNIADHLLQHAMDKDAIRRGQNADWINEQAIYSTATARAEKMAAAADKSCLINDAFMGVVAQIFDTCGQTQVDDDTTIKDGIHVTPRRNRLVRGGILTDVTEIVTVPMLESLQPPPSIAFMPPDGSEDSSTALEMDQTSQTSDVQPSPKSRTLTKTIKKTQGARTASSSGRPVSQDLRRRVTSFQALQKLMNPDGGELGQGDGLFGTTSTAGSEVTAAVSDGLSAGYQSLSSRRRSSVRSREESRATPANENSRPARHQVVDAHSFTTASDSLGKNNAPIAQNAEEQTTTKSDQIREELDNKWGHYLQPEPKASVENAPAEEFDNDEDYIPEEKSTTKRKSAAQLQKTPTKQRKPTVQPSHPRQQRFHDGNYGTAVGTIRPLELIPIERQQSGERQRAIDSHNLLRPPQQSLPDTAGRVSTTATSAQGEPSKRKRNKNTIFGLERNQELAKPVEASENVEYTWSANEAEFAEVARSARYAFVADRIVGNNTPWSADTMEELKKLKDAHDRLEQYYRGCTTRAAKKSKFAGCASWARYAGRAEAADFALEISGLDKNAEKSDEN
ncbi:hypothetical protein VFPPC_07520 [Pochonia chlamydosporia 170]|uniref:Uncharacterized protein n=1 Tax=Pochonia chlamydosporia 170 TaxID=1380566 RepID=A0A179FJV4_METCM|nr:hypothetical protein VFPPC_07520 [Pochonia chlamydosporia 170]OAQ65886.2 hypothetical protein VFPPC_07520 [Pochonia chlamydosporia 170]